MITAKIGTFERGAFDIVWCFCTKAFLLETGVLVTEGTVFFAKRFNRGGVFMLSVLERGVLLTEGWCFYAKRFRKGTFTGGGGGLC